MKSGKMFDSYSLRARVMPVAIAFLPLALATFPWFPKDALAVPAAVVTALLIVLAFVFSHLARDQGRKIEGDLFKKWGGVPSVIILRHADDHLNPESKKRAVSSLLRLMSGLVWPTARKEKSDPESADQTYEACCHFLRERTRDTSRFSVLFEENVGYGFRRNLLGLKATGIAMAVTGMLSAASAATVRFATESPDVWIPVIFGVLSIVILVFWVSRVRDTWVREAAFRYAERLVLSAFELERSI